MDEQPEEVIFAEAAKLSRKLIMDAGRCFLVLGAGSFLSRRFFFGFLHPIRPCFYVDNFRMMNKTSMRETTQAALGKISAHSEKDAGFKMSLDQLDAGNYSIIGGTRRENKPSIFMDSERTRPEPKAVLKGNQIVSRL